MNIERVFPEISIHTLHSIKIKARKNNAEILLTGQNTKSQIDPSFNKRVKGKVAFLLEAAIENCKPIQSFVTNQECDWDDLELLIDNSPKIKDESEGSMTRPGSELQLPSNQTELKELNENEMKFYQNEDDPSQRIPRRRNATTNLRILIGSI